MARGPQSLADVKPYASPEIYRKERPAAREQAYAKQGDGRWSTGLGPAGSGSPDSVGKVHQPGGAVQTQSLQHPAYNTFERQYRTLPEDAFYQGITPSRPFTFSLGSFTVPRNNQLWLTDYEFSILRLSGADPGDFVYVEAGRFSGQLGFDLNVDGQRGNNISYQLDPKPLADIRSEFRSSAGNTAPSIFGAPSLSDFDEAAANTFGATSGQGTSLLPVRPNVMGARSGPFTMVIPSGGTVAMNVTLFRALTSPIAAFQGNLGGFLIGEETAIAIINRMFPQ